MSNIFLKRGVKSGKMLEKLRKNVGENDGKIKKDVGKNSGKIRKNDRLIPLADATS